MGARGRGLLVAGGAAVALVITAIWRTYTRTSAAELLRAGRADEALSMLERELPSWRILARIWPGQFRDALASALVDHSLALRKCGRDTEAAAAAGEAVLAFRQLAAARPRKFTAGLADALYRVSYPLAAVAGQEQALAAAEEAVRLYRGLAAGRPAQYTPPLAQSLTRQAIMLARLGRPGDALAAATGAAGLYQAAVATDRYPYSAAQVLLVQGRVLCDLSRQREAARPLAQGWQLAASWDYQDLLGYARPALETACQADPAGFTSTWHAETGTEPPDWLPRPDSAPGT